MAIFHFSLQNISANKGKCAVAAASYRSGERLYDERQGVYYYYEKNVGADSFILKPDYAPEWCLNREMLWNEVEKKESSKNSRYAKEINIALPIELTDEEQERIVKEYCQRTFVDAGMVADIAIHRKDKNNPHFHVMLTNRPFNPDGSWGKKWEIEYILDKDGNKTYTKNGNVKKRTIPTVNWDDESTLISWRREWANHVNLALAERGYAEIISPESFETDGIKMAPTIHEGTGYQSKANKQYNADVKRQRQDRDKLSDAKERIYTFERFDLLTKNLSDKNRERISELSGSLKTFIDFQNVEDKKRMIYNWRTSTYVKQNLGVDVARTFNTIGDQETAIHEADAILLSMSKRLLDKIYPHVNQRELTDYEIKWLADKTIRGGVLTKEEAEHELQELRPHLLEKQVLLITKQPFAGWLNLEKYQRITESKIKAILKLHERDIGTYQDTGNKAPAEFYGEDFKKLGYLFKDLSRTAALKEVITAHYNDVLFKAFPEADLDKLPILEKETVYNLVMYFNPENRALTLDELFSLTEQGKFSREEREAGLRFICSGDIGEISNNAELVRVLSNDGMKSLFIGECMEDETISPDLLGAATEKMTAEENEKKQYVERADSGLSYPVRKSVSIYNHLLSLLSVGEALFFGYDEEEIRKQKARNKRLAEHEKDMKKDGHKQQREPHL